MFGFLKEKLTNFTEKLKKSVEKKEAVQGSLEKEENEESVLKKEIPIEIEKTQEELINQAPILKEKETTNKISEKPPIKETKINTNQEIKIIKKDKPIEISREEKTPIKNNEEKTTQENESIKNIEETNINKTSKNQITIEKPIEIIQEEQINKTLQEQPTIKNNEETNKQIENPNLIKEKPKGLFGFLKPKIKKEEDKRELKEEDKRELKAKVSTAGKIKSLFSGKVKIQDNDINDLLFELELSLIESDVEQDAASEIVNQIKQKLLGQEIQSKDINQILNNLIKEILNDMMQTEKIDLLEEIKKSKKPYIILMLGPNGAGKTTSLAKLTNYFKENNLKSVWAAADTFRSGAIDQLQEHANKLETKLIKQQYGADPTAVAFDALNSAKANNYDVLLIDTAGRQETNKNLMNELEKMSRVIKPNFKIYVGEAYTGQGLLDMASEFNEIIGIDGFILTKMDADAKGGTTISLIYKLKKPVLYIGTGQEYKDFEKFENKFIINRIL
jgi:fused signal recognition particle receptor